MGAISIRAGGSVFRGGLKITRPKCIHLFSGGARCLQVYPEGARCIQGYDRCIQVYLFFPTNKKKSGVSFRCCQVYLEVLRGGLATPRRFRGGLATPRRFQAYLGLNYC